MTGTIQENVEPPKPPKPWVRDDDNDVLEHVMDDLKEVYKYMGYKW